MSYSDVTPPNSAFVRAVAGLLSSRVSVLVLGLLSDVVITRALGPEARGVYAYVILLVAVLSVLWDAGMANAGTYFTSKDDSARTPFVWTALFIGLIGSTLTVAVLVLIRTYRVAELPVDLSLAALWMTGAIVLVTTFLNASKAILAGRKNFVDLTGIMIFEAALILVLAVPAFWLKHPLVYLLITLAVARASSSMWAWRRLGIGPMATIPKAQVREVLSFASKSHVANIMTVISYRVDQFIVVTLLGPAALAYYAIAVSLSERLTVFAGSIAQVLMPYVAADASSDRGERTKVMVVAVILMLGTIALTIAAVAPRVITFAYGEAFSPTVMPLLIMLPGAVVLSVSKVLAADLSGRGMPGYAMYSSVVVALATVGLNLILVPQFGISGAALASTIAYVLSMSLLIWGFTRETGAHPRELMPSFGHVRALKRRARSLLKDWSPSLPF